MYLLNNNRQWTKHAKDELNVPTQHSTFSNISKIKHCTIQEHYVIKTGNRLISSTMLHNQHKYYHDLLLAKTFPKNTPLFAVIQHYFS